MKANEVNTTVEWDPNNIVFKNWLASKFCSHKIMVRHTKNALWDYWRIGDDEEVMVNYELSNHRDENLIEENEIAQIFRIKTDIFHFKTPSCEAFKEFNYLLKIDVDIYEWNNGIPWVDEKPWIDEGVWTEPTDNIDHECKPLHFKSGHAEWPTCNWKEDGYCNTGDLPGLI
ncbi:hypothetical protein Tco_0508592 [Tanacetum coccineum]